MVDITSQEQISRRRRGPKETKTEGGYYQGHEAGNPCVEEGPHVQYRMERADGKSSRQDGKAGVDDDRYDTTSKMPDPLGGDNRKDQRHRTLEGVRRSARNSVERIGLFFTHNGGGRERKADDRDTRTPAQCYREHDQWQK